MIYKTSLLLLMSTAAHAAIIHHLDEFKAIDVGISQQGLTRIAVKGDRIASVFGMTGEYALETDEEQGQIFIRPLDYEFPFSEETKDDPTPKPIHLTLTTEGGHTQDLRLTPQDKPPEAIIFKIDEDTKMEIHKEQQNHAPIMREEVEELMRSSREGRIPLGYKSVPLDLNTLQEPYLLVKELKGEKLRCLTYEVKNNTSAPLILSEEEFARSKGLLKESKNQGPRSAVALSERGLSEALIALLISKKTVMPGEGAFVYVIVRAIH